LLSLPSREFLKSTKKKEKPPGTSEAEFVRAEGLVGIHPARISADQAMQVVA
jgi:hypothetical protein